MTKISKWERFVVVVRYGRTRDLDVGIVRLGTVLDYSAQTTGVDCVLELPKGVAGQIVACDSCSACVYLCIGLLEGRVVIPTSHLFRHGSFRLFHRNHSWRIAPGGEGMIDLHYGRAWARKFA